MFEKSHGNKVKFECSIADPGFPRGGGANSPGGAPTYDFAKISQKLHEIESPKFYYVDPPLMLILFAVRKA